MSSELENSAAEAKQIKRNRVMGIVVLSAVFLPMLIAYLLFKTEFAIPTNTVNKGELMQPPQEIVNLPLYNEAGDSVSLLDGEKRWRILIPGESICDSQCEKTLYLTRQVHTRLGNKAGRVERYYLNTDKAFSSASIELFKTEYPQLNTVYMNADDFKGLLADSNITDNFYQRYFLMDQEGFIMMSYLPSNTGNEFLKDIKRLLKYSYED